MNMKFVAIQVECKGGNTSFRFSPHISAIYGNVGVGKTTLMNLISFCLGNDLVRTTAVDSYVLGASLTISINEELYILKRRISSNFIVVKTQYGECQYKTKDSQSTGAITDFFYEMAGMRSLFLMPRNKSNNTKKIKITYPNFFWFSYLRQDEIDNSLFYFGDSQNYFKETASKGVIYDLLGGDSQMDTEYQSLIGKYVTALSETKQRITFCNELKTTTSLFSINISSEISRKQKEILELKRSLNAMLSSNEVALDSGLLSELLSIQHEIGLYEAEIKYLIVLGRIKSVLDSQVSNKAAFEEKISSLEKEKKEIVEKSELFHENLNELQSLLLNTLHQIKFPGIEQGDSIKISSKDFIPNLCSFSGKKKFDFYNLSSGGKKTIYKLCYAIAIHRLIGKKSPNTLIPKVLIIDTPMKNISEREDAELYNNLFSLLHELFSKSGELSDTQLIVVDKELHPYFDNENVSKYHFSNEKPLIPNY